MILGLDTSAGQCAAALVAADGAPVARNARQMQRGHAEALFPVIEAVLTQAGIGFADLGGIAVCTGPGSFTGIRVGVAAARGLALGLDVPAVGIDRFRALVRSRQLAGADLAADMPIAVALRAPQETAYFHLLDGDENAAPSSPEARRLNMAELETAAPPGALRLGDAWPGATPEAGLPDPAAIAADFMTARRLAKGPAKPFYLRDAGAAPPREAPPVILDP